MTLGTRLTRTGIAIDDDKAGGLRIVLENMSFPKLNMIIASVNGALLLAELEMAWGMRYCSGEQLDGKLPRKFFIWIVSGQNLQIRTK